MTPSTTAAPSRPAWMVTTKILFSAHLRVAVWFWAALILVLIGGHVLMGWVIPGRALIARYATQPLLWFAFSMTIIVVYAYLPVHVTSGLTRRAFIRATLIGAVLIGLLHGVLLGLAVGIERSVLAGIIDPAAGGGPFIHWDSGTGIVDPAAGQGPFTHWDSVWGITVAQMLVMIAAVLSGLLIAMTYYRTSPLKGTLLLVVTVTPLLAVLALVAVDAELQALLGLPTSLLIAALASLAVIAAMALAFHLTARHVPIRSVEQK